MENLENPGENPVPAEEDEKLNELKQLVDSASMIIEAGSLTKNEGNHLLEQVRRRALEFFPDKQETFNLIYETRLKRLIEEFCIPDS